MESMNDDVHEPTTSTPAAAVAGVDLISELTDDLLLRILSFLPAASEVARTSVLSRRWRHLWPNAVALRFTVGSKPNFSRPDDDINNARRLIAAVDATFARRAGGPDVEDLEVSFIYSSEENIYFSCPSFYLYKHYHAADITSAHVGSWLRFSAQRVTGRFTLAVPLERKERLTVLDAEEEDGDEEEEEVLAADEAVEEEDGAAAAMEEDVVAGAEEVDDEPMAGYGDVDPDELPEAVEEDEEGVEAELEDEEDEELVAEYNVYNLGKDEERVFSVELPCSTRAKEMSLTLAKATLTVPAASAGAFRSLTDIMLSHVCLKAGNGDDIRLGHLLSSCCSPLLRRVQLKYTEGLAALRLDAADRLVELRLFWLPGLQTLDVDAPGLRYLGVRDCGKDTAMRISAPELEVLACDSICHAEQLRFDGAGSVRRIEDLPLYSHRLTPHNKYDYENSAALWLLRHCTSLNQLSVKLTLSWFWGFQVSLPLCVAKSIDGEEIGHEDMMPDIPELPNIRSLRIINVKTWCGDGHRIGATMAKLIAKCTNIEYLFINIDPMEEECIDPNCICDHPKGWENQKISLPNLRNVEISDSQLLQSDVNLLRLLLTSAPALERLTMIQGTTFEEDEVVDFDVPCYGGHWAPCVWECDGWGSIYAKKYTWTQGNQSGGR
ncbi:hypothetical protein BAE44_0003709 [Dichanthelium oligosanthes]|uniref:F-box domain-containing protein n=1 Tax=Dichanthelium oligosanthes TaxID=888268 RepID=A0A1E5WD12_9POAL|nr:hypothetical protein BAE44_0003709 [Dichanthelium oligosanthes]